MAPAQSDQKNEYSDPSGHVPVLLKEVLQQSEQTRSDLRRPLNWILDFTFGRGGHTRALLAQQASARAVVGDRDPQAIAAADRLRQDLAPGRLIVEKRSFAEWVEPNGLLSIPTQIQQSVAANGGFDFILLDLGVSSPQLDQPDRGFSFYSNGPLDMRMDPTRGPTARDILMAAEATELRRIFVELGEVHQPDRVVSKIMQVRSESSLQTTSELARLIESTDGWRVKGFHPATQYFMALRMYVNQELDEIRAVLPAALSALSPNGRLAVISFHSHEDRMVKALFRKIDDCRGLPCEVSAQGNTVVFRGSSPQRKAIQPTDDEVQLNPRSRSAKLRVMRRMGVDEPAKGKNKYAHLKGGSS